MKPWTFLYQFAYHCQPLLSQFLPLDEAVASRAVFFIVSGSEGRTGRRKRFWSQLYNSKNGKKYRPYVSMGCRALKLYNGKSANWWGQVQCSIIQLENLYRHSVGDMILRQTVAELFNPLPTGLDPLCALLCSIQLHFLQPTESSW